MAGQEEHAPPSRPFVAFVISLIAGLWILSMGSMAGWSAMGWHGPGGHTMQGWNWRGDGGHAWMWQHHQVMHAYGGTAWTWIGILTGIVVLIGAVTLILRPAATRSCGIAIVTASVIALFAGAGGLAAGVLGIIGGALAITWTPVRE